MKPLLGLLLFTALTLMTQIGGLALLAGWAVVRLFTRRVESGLRTMAALLAAFSAIYAAMTIILVPPLAAFFGRVQLPCAASDTRPYAAAHPLYCALNRNYVTPRLKSLLNGLARHMATSHPETVTLYLDANFPFHDGFPLLPHMSHDDGRKLDLAFYYNEPSGRYAPGALRSPIGYWAFEKPSSGDRSLCGRSSGLSLRWDMAWLQPYLPELTLDAARTASALRWLVTEGRALGVETVFIEPYLARRLGVASPLLRFQGCRAARHDDHIHLQVGKF